MATDEEGFTLIELVIATVALTILVAVMGGVFSVSLKTTAETQARLDGSHDAQISGAYFSKDAQSADTVSVPVPATVVGACGTDPALASFSWTDQGVSKEASYGYRVSSKQLVRSYCEGSSPPAVTTLGGALAAQPSNPVCSPNCSSARTVQLTVVTDDGYSFILTGSRRET